MAKAVSPSCSTTVFTGIGRGRCFCLFVYIQLYSWLLERSVPIHSSLAFGTLNVRTFPCPMWEAPHCSLTRHQGHCVCGGSVLQNLPSGILEMPQPSCCLSTVDTVPTPRGKPAVGYRAPWIPASLPSVVDSHSRPLRCRLPELQLSMASRVFSEIWRKQETLMPRRPAAEIPYPG